MLIRFAQSDTRAPCVGIWRGLVDWISGSLLTSLGQRDFEDFQPYLGSDVGCAISSDGGSPTTALQTDEYGVINITESAGTNECIGYDRQIYYDLQNSPVTCIETRVEQNADANTPQLFAGFFDGTNPDDVFASGAIVNGGSENAIGLLWNNDETIDIVAVDDGTLTVLKNDIGVTLERTDGKANLGLRIERINSATYRMTPAVNGTVARAGIVSVASTSLPEVAMRPTVASTVAATTAPSIDIDYVLTGNK